jgi:uncharacterized membrane protein
MLKTAFKICFGLGFLAAGANHFLHPRLYVRIMPPYLPFPAALVYVSGVCEMALGALLLTRWQSWAAWGLIALLIAVFPANLQMALHPELYPEFAPVLLWVRLPFQVVFIAWAYAYT